MTRIVIGIHLHTEPDGLTATLGHLRRATTLPVEILLLLDGPDAPMRQTLESLRGLRQLASSQLLGAAESFNRMLRASDADVLVFLEAGALVGPGWLEQLLAALSADPRNGLAGPSTNRSWNMQAAFPEVREADIAATAALAEARFRGSWRTMEPLYCLADFCYAVRRNVIDAIGGADAAYRLGPCWEMDYTLRAARAGFRAVWAQSAFVYRRPPTARRQQDEARWFIASKRLYQDKFCDLRLSGERTSYARHCEGEACRHFAPKDRIRLALPLDEPAQRLPAPLLVSCIMPTRNRRDWMLQSISYFQRQAFNEAELIIVDDGDDDFGNIVSDPRIRYIRPPRMLSVGAKRNLACSGARGSFIIHWDDDDWYAADRIGRQVAPLLAGEADITALCDTHFFDLERWEFWACTAELYNRLFVHGVHGGTLAYRREVFERLARFPDASLAEDAAFLNAAVARGARLKVIPADDLFLYLRHCGNAWAFTCGHYLDPHGWRRIAEPSALARDRAFYAARSAAAAARLDGIDGSAAPAAASTPAAASSCPLVSCIMPTYNRRVFVPKAIEYFLRQDYPNRELIILDDGDDRVDDLVTGAASSLRYIALRERLRLGAKRNSAIEASRGEIIVHWDDDDWMDPARISTQVGALLAAGADICGLSKVWFCEVASGRLSRYCYPATQRRWLYGASLCYRRSLWQQKRFEPLDIGEDTRFVWAQPTGRMVDLGDQRLIVAMIHGTNTSRPRPLVGPHWSTVIDVDAAGMFGDDWSFYAVLCNQAQPRAA